MTTTSATPQRLYLFQLAAGILPAPTGQMMDFSAGCYLVQMGDGKNVLIDSGFPANYASPAGAPSIERGKNVIEQLAELGLQADDIDLLVCTHFDVDHAGHHDAFTQAELVVQREHYELARSGHPRFAGARSHWDHPALRYRLIEGDTELLPGLVLLETSGHTPGHQSVLVYLPHTGPVLLAVDAVSMQRVFTVDRRATPNDDNEEQLRASTRKLLDVVEREHVALVVFHHDGAHAQEGPGLLRLTPARQADDRAADHRNPETQHHRHDGP
jgi:N-acyl homoserine lactone hydrolase